MHPCHTRGRRRRLPTHSSGRDGGRRRGGCRAPVTVLWPRRRQPPPRRWGRRQKCGDGGRARGGHGGGRRRGTRSGTGLSGGLPPRLARRNSLFKRRGGVPPCVLLRVIRGLSFAGLLIAGAAFFVLSTGTAGTLRESRTLSGGMRPWGLRLRGVLVAAIIGAYCLSPALLSAAASARRLWGGMLPRLAYELGRGGSSTPS